MKSHGSYSQAAGAAKGCKRAMAYCLGNLRQLRGLYVGARLADVPELSQALRPIALELRELRAKAEWLSGRSADVVQRFCGELPMRNGRHCETRWVGSLGADRPRRRYPRVRGVK
jgi:hypothetical protein